MKSGPKLSDMIGGTPEIDSKFNDIPCKALLDTGSQITTVSNTFYHTNLTNLPLQNCHDILRVEGVGGNSLPYHGFITCEVSVPLTDITSFSRHIPVLVVPDTNYNKTTPCIIGTNFLSKIPTDKSLVSSFTQHVKSAIQILQLRHEILEQSHGVYSTISANEGVTIQPFSTATVAGVGHITVPLERQIALIEGYDDFPVISGITRVGNGENLISFELVNYTDKPIVIKRGQEVAHLHQATVVPTSSDSNQTAVPDFLASFDFSHLSDMDTNELKTFLSRNRDVFAMNNSEMGQTNAVTHSIELLDSTPFKEKGRPIPPSAFDELREHLTELLSAGIIKKSRSPFSSNIVLVRKKDGSLRLCVDYRKLNSRTKKDAYNLPRTDVLIDSLQGATYFASLDLFSGYHQVAMDPESQERTAFSAGPLGFFQYTRMPFGLCNSPSTFQRLMEEVLNGLTMVKCAVYIDDIIVFAKSKSELYDRLTEIFDRLRQANLTLKPKKCSFFQSSVDFLGHTVSAEGVSCSKKHLEAVTNWPEPKDVSDLQTFLGFTGFYRRFIPGYSAIAYPLLKLLKTKDEVKGNNRSKKKRKADYVPWEWGVQQQEAFLKLIESLTTAPILVYPDPDKAFTLHVDASRKGLGAVLYQEVDGKLRVVAYASRSLVGSEKNYTVHKLEFLALKWAITTKFTHYLYGKKFSVYTDHNPLVYVTSTAKLDANGHRWLESLAAYNFTIHYKPGRTNSDADGLSRRPHPEAEQRQCHKVISPEVFKELCTLVSGDQDYAGIAESLGLSPTTLCQATRVSKPELADWAKEQDQDPDTARVKELIQKGTRPNRRLRNRESPVVTRLLTYWDTLSVENNILLKSSRLGEESVKRVVIPSHKQKECLHLIHDDMGHLGRDKTLSVAQERFFWIGLMKDIEQKLKTCHRCLCAKAPNLPERAPLVSIVTTRPMELVCMDFLSLETAVGGYQSILVVTDHFTRYACAFPTRNQEAKTVAKILVDEYFTHYGIPERLHSDQGANFQGRVITHLCKLLNIKKSRTTPYHPQGDGMTERFNKTLISMLKTLEPSQKPRWKEHVASLVHAYNCTRHESTQYSPFFLMFGRQPRLPIDIFLGRDPNYTASVEAVKLRLEEAYKAASDAARKAARKQAGQYNKKIRGHGLQAGDTVLLKNIGLKGKQKLADKWQAKPFVVVDQPNTDIPVYKIQRDQETRMIHRNLLLPVQLPFDLPETDQHAQPQPQPDLESDAESDDLQLTVEIPPLEMDLEGPSILEMDNPQGDGGQEILADARDGNATPNVPEEVHEVEEAEELVEGDAPENLGLRRSQRTRRPPVWFNDYVMNQCKATVTDWRDRVTILLSLVQAFPAQQAEIVTGMLNVISSIN